MQSPHDSRATSRFAMPLPATVFNPRFSVLETLDAHTPCNILQVRTILFPMDDDQLRSSSMQAWSAVGRLVPAIADTARGNCAFSNETVSTLMADVSATLTTDGLLDGNLSAIDDPSVLAAFDDGDVLVTCTIGQVGSFSLPFNLN